MAEWIEDQGCDVEGAIRELRHLCDERGIDFAKVDKNAYQVYLEEHDQK